MAEKDDKVVNIMGPPGGPKLTGKKIYVEVYRVDTAPGQIQEIIYVDWPKDGSFTSIEEIQATLMNALQALRNMQMPSTQLGTRPFPTERPPFVPERN
jgi:hypothetical protein